MNNIIVLMGHGNYATGIESTVKLVVGPTVGVNYIDFLEEDSSEALMAKATKVVKENEENNIVFICDILGGTPFNTAVKISLEYKGVGVVAGCNMNAIIEMIMMKDSFELEDLTDELVERTRSSVYKYKVSEVVSKEDINEEGI